MPKTVDSDESRMIKACEAARLEKTPNITKIAREFGVNRRNLQNRVRNLQSVFPGSTDGEPFG